MARHSDANASAGSVVVCIPVYASRSSLTQLQPSDLHDAELNYEQIISTVQLLNKDEDARRLRVRVQLLRDEVDDLNEKLWEEQDRGEEAEVDAEEWQSRAEESSSTLARVETQLRSKMAEFTALQAELTSLRDISANSQKLLTEKLALTREMEQIRPELDHLRCTTTSNKGLLAEKLSLEREMSNIKAELENEKQASKQLRERETQLHQDEARHDRDLDAVRKELAKAQRDIGRTEKKASVAEADRVKDLEKQLAKETTARQTAEELAEQQVAEACANLEKELGEERQKRRRSAESQSARDEAELGELRSQLANEKRERQRLEKELRKQQADAEADKAVLEDKLDQFRTKLRSTKEKLKESQAEAQEARALAATKAPKSKTVAANSRKRPAPEADVDATIGTPGDGPGAKRNKRASSVLREKSTFSITPFLNKTAASVAGSSPASNNPDEPIASIEDDDSPSMAKSKQGPAPEQAVQPLAEASPGKSNPKVAVQKRRKVARPSSLEQVLEEEAEEESPKPEKAKAPLIETEKENRPRQTSVKPLLKPRKSLSTFASFREGSLPPQPLQQKKKRKLGGSGLKTIFDEDEENEQPIGPTARNIAGQRHLGGFGNFGGGLGRLGSMGQKKKGPLTTADGGFQFSPLKRDRRAGSVRP